jgi:hypothetical protein
MIRIQLIHEGRVVKQISSRLHESVILEQVKRYQDPVDAIVIVEGQLSEDAKSILGHVAKKIIPAAMAAGIALGAGSAQAQGGANPHYPGLNHTPGQVLSDIFSPNYRERVRQRDFERETQRRTWNAQAQVDRQARIDAARQGARQQVGASSVKIYDQARISQDGKSYILYDMENRVTRIPVAGTEFMNGDSQRLPHYISRNGSVYYVRHAAQAQPLRQSQFSEDIGTVGTIPAAGTAGKTQFAKTGTTTDVKFNNKGQLELDSAELDDDAIAALKKAGVEIKEANGSDLAAIFDAYPEAVKAFKEGGDLSDFPDFYDALYEYYFDEMPYGVAKARDGDPINWISDRLQDELDLHQPMEARSDDDEADPEAATAVDQATADKNIVMQIRKAADYEKPMALSLGDGSTQKIDALLAKKILGFFDGLKPQSKELMQNMLNTKEGFAKIIGHINEQEIKESLAEVDQIANGMKPILEMAKQAKNRARSIINAAYAQVSEQK